MQTWSVTGNDYRRDGSNKETGISLFVCVSFSMPMIYNRHINQRRTEMKDGELIGKVHNSVYQQCRKRGYATPVDVLMDVGILQKQKYEEWRFGKISYLEAVCNCNLRQLSFLLKQIRCYADKTGLKPSSCYYNPKVE